MLKGTWGEIWSLKVSNILHKPHKPPSPIKITDK